MVNVHINSDRTPFGVLEVDSTEHTPFDQDDIAFLLNYANLIGAAIHRLRGHEALVKSLNERELLSRELHHRVHNVLALVQSLAKLTTHEGRSAEQFKQLFLPRLSALGRAEALALKEHGNGVDLQELLENILEPYSIGGLSSIKIAGEAVALNAKQARMLALVVHELATNASKYGSLSVPLGHVDLAWQVTGPPERHLTFTWHEHGGPPVKSPNSSGFGSRLIERACASELGGNAELRYEHDGLKCDINFKLPDLR
jgi:two-component sensor histidine kinase